MSDFYFAFCQGDVLLTREGTIPEGEPPVEFQPWEHVTDISLNSTSLPPTNQHLPLTEPLSVSPRGGERFARVGHIYRLDRPVTGRENLQMVGLRQSYDVLSPEMYQLAGKCAELVYWDQNSRYCGCCGAPMRWQTEISKQCTECGKELWPQLQTAIIVRVTRGDGGKREEVGGRGDEVLLVRAHNFRGSYYGLVAGFVETGETLEAHIRVRNIRYFASQPWPYPAGLMVGFTAEYESGELRLQRSELAGGGWFRRDELPNIPGPVSLARRLIDAWLKTTDCTDETENMF